MSVEPLHLPHSPAATEIRERALEREDKDVTRWRLSEKGKKDGVCPCPQALGLCLQRVKVMGPAACTERAVKGEPRATSRGELFGTKPFISVAREAPTPPTRHVYS